MHFHLTPALYTAVSEILQNFYAHALGMRIMVSVMGAVVADHELGYSARYDGSKSQGRDSSNPWSSSQPRFNCPLGELRGELHSYLLSHVLR